MGAYPSGEALWRKPDHRQLPRLLRARRERPRGRAAKQRDELASSYVEHGLPPEPAVPVYCRLLEAPAGPWGRPESF
jgi:hypothetical protein